MPKSLITLCAALLCGTLSLSADALADPAVKPAARLVQPPLVMRLGKDEFRIAFGLDTSGCAVRGCGGVIRYSVAWRTEDGTRASENRRVSYRVPPHYGRALTVDRQYFDTAEGAHTTELVNVTVASISCR